MTCLTQPPATAADWFATVDRCAESYGGPAWQQLAVIGLATLVVVIALALLVGAIVWAGR